MEAGVQLRVVITCVRCGQKGEVHITGGWDIKKVMHECKPKEGERSVVTPPGDGRFHCTFEPSRGVF